MSSQIDSSIPVLTEVIVDAIKTPVTNNATSTQTTPAHQERTIDTLLAKQHVDAVFPYVKETKAPFASAINALADTAEALNQMESSDASEVDNFIEPELKMGSEEDWKQLENTLKENILRQVLARVDFVLEHKIRDSLAEILQVSVDKLASDIQFGLKNSLEEVVTRAVTQEIAKAKNTNTNTNKNTNTNSNKISS